MPFLDKTGLAHLWNQIVARLNTKVEKTELDELEASLTEQIGNIDLSGKMNAADPVGTGSFSMNRASGSTVGQYSSTLGFDTAASGNYSHAEGCQSVAGWHKSHAEGDITVANGYAAHSEGVKTYSLGRASHSEGEVATLGNYSITGDANAKSYTVNPSISNQYVGRIIEYVDSSNKRNYAYIKSVSDDNVSIVTSKTLSATALTNASIKIIRGAAYGSRSHSEGYETIALGDSAHAEGSNTIAYNSSSHAEGSKTSASGVSSHAEGWYSEASGDYSHAEGWLSKSSGECSHAEGYQTMADGTYQHVQGKWNISDTTSAHIVGNGDSKDARSNAHTLDWDGNAWFAGDVYVGSTSGTNKDEGSVKLATMNDINDLVASIAEIKNHLGIE